MSDHGGPGHPSHAGTVPDPQSCRVSFWPYTKAPRSVQAVAEKLWPNIFPHAQARSISTIAWIGCCGAAENPGGFPHWLQAGIGILTDGILVGPYWWCFVV